MKIWGSEMPPSQASKIGEAGRSRSFQEIDALFKPRSVAVVGVPRGPKTAKLFLLSLLELGYQGTIYPVHPEASRIEGIKAYPSVNAIPGPVDLAIILVPHRYSLPVVRECAGKGVKGAVLFTAGYEETGTEEGRRLQEEMLQEARKSGMRLIGPNCMGIYCPASGLSFFPGLSKEPGPLGIVSQSGSLANILARMGPQMGLYFSKVISIGNESDLSSADFLEYLGEDPQTRIIGAYLEGVRNGRRFFRALARAASQKPVILWRAGLTREGARAAASHTGSLGSAREIWESVVRQSGAVSIHGFEPWVDALMAFSLLPEAKGRSMAVVSGPGGLAVSAAEA